MSFVSDRHSPTEMALVDEIVALMEREAKRSPGVGKESAHFATFELPIRWLELLGLPTKSFTDKQPWQDLLLQNSELVSQIVERTLSETAAGNTDLAQLLPQITAYLGEEDVPQPSDEIFVFGSKSTKRIEKAVELYEQKLAPRIFISGGAPIYEKREEGEAIIYKNWAIEHGVPAEAIFVHDTAISVADNVRGGLNALDTLHLPYDSMLLVTAWFALRRSYATMTKYVPMETKLYRVAASMTPGGDYEPDGWWKNENGIKMIFKEFSNLSLSDALNSS